MAGERRTTQETFAHSVILLYEVHKISKTILFRYAYLKMVGETKKKKKKKQGSDYDKSQDSDYHYEEKRKMGFLRGKHF